MPRVTETFGETAKIHLPIHWTTGALIDRSMPVGTTWPRAASGKRAASGSVPEDEIGQRLVLPFVVIDTGDGSFVEISSRTTANARGNDNTGICEPFAVERRPPSARVDRTQSGFTVTFTTHTEGVPEVRSVGSIDETIETHVGWIRENYNGETVANRIASGELPDWLRSVPLAVTFDMWLPNGEVAHNYAHLRDFCRDMNSIGVPPGTIIYIPGWVGPYDAGYPYYKPVPELGGRSAFAEAMAAAHEAGYRIMAHTLGGGSDPYVPDFEKHVGFVMRNYNDPRNPPPPIVHPFQRRPSPDGSPIAGPPKNDPLRGPFAGWAGGGTYYRVDSPPMAETVGTFVRSANGWLFDAPEVPERCEAVVSVSGLEGVGAGTVKLTINGRSLTTPAGWFLDNDSYEFPFTYLLSAGANPVEITTFGAKDNAGGLGEGGTPPAGKVTFTVVDMYGHDPAQNIWTQPAVWGEFDDPRWHKAFCEYLAPTVAEFGIDLVHIDATAIWRWDDGGMYAEVQRRLPEGTCFGTEVASEAGMAFFQIKQTRIPTGTGGVFSNYGGTDGAAVTRAGDEWRPSGSDLPRLFSSQYGHFYAHLCSGRGFVPHYTSCSVNPLPESLTSEEVESVHEFMRCSVAASIVPSLRVNYRDFGLDDETRKFLEESIIT